MPGQGEAGTTRRAQRQGLSGALRGSQKIDCENLNAFRGQSLFLVSWVQIFIGLPISICMTNTANGPAQQEAAKHFRRAENILRKRTGLSYGAYLLDHSREELIAVHPDIALGFDGFAFNPEVSQ